MQRLVSSLATLQPLQIIRLLSVRLLFVLSRLAVQTPHLALLLARTLQPVVVTSSLDLTLTPQLLQVAANSRLDVNKMRIG
jgi:hypothetical protein